MKKQVVVIDDDESYVYLLQRKLKSLKEDISFSSYPTGKEAIEYFSSLDSESRLPDVVILDLNMPVMDGFHFLEKFRKICDSHKFDVPPPVLFVATSSDVEADRHRVAKCQIAQDYLVKPINIERVAQALRTA